MEFGKSILSPSYNRKTDFDSVREVGKNFNFECVNCQNTIEGDFQSIIGQEFSWHSELDAETYAQVKKFYDMSLVGKTPDGGKLRFWKQFAKIVRQVI